MIDKMIEWCHREGLFIKRNDEFFFLNERLSIKPQYVINNKVFIDLIDPNEKSRQYFEFCKLFSHSFGTIILIPTDRVADIMKVSKKDIENRFGIKFRPNNVPQ